MSMAIRAAIIVVSLLVAALLCLDAKRLQRELDALQEIADAVLEKER